MIGQVADRAAYLRLAETLSVFLTRMTRGSGHAGCPAASTDRAAIVKDVLVGDDAIVIRHSIPLPSSPTDGNDRTSTSSGGGESYLLRSVSSG
jgi:site-specific DNA recombinase